MKYKLEYIGSEPFYDEKTGSILIKVHYATIMTDEEHKTAINQLTNNNLEVER